jgi:hypothetical protein
MLAQQSFQLLAPVELRWGAKPELSGREPFYDVHEPTTDGTVPE